MIDLRVADYCQNCPHFEAETEEIIANFSACFIITCANSEKCRALLKHLDTDTTWRKKFSEN